MPSPRLGVLLLGLAAAALGGCRAAPTGASMGAAEPVALAGPLTCVFAKYQQGLSGISSVQLPVEHPVRFAIWEDGLAYVPDDLWSSPLSECRVLSRADAAAVLAQLDAALHEFESDRCGPDMATYHWHVCRRDTQIWVRILAFYLVDCRDPAECARRGTTGLCAGLAAIRDKSQPADESQRLETLTRLVEVR